ncbi:MAG: acyl carrier protein [Candidatus Marinimicrobia bacterium]|nr:acyl carrier protein [Gammaproteobacteria bacterium]MBT4605572.1 acyl carrier protein [Thiotrichales bacterium]MBT4948054.1 acyl carrier protein [Candidatus Neomarinimicrobiota bacterium]MBT5371333.1 acyl carrier protein [Gammaproteobacteria bacterium]MBT6217716.1 acyl carrier protein [Candidatus Neomarinimicrobiota bacterium]
MAISQEEIEQFVLGYLPADIETEALATVNFVDSGLLDSFGILSMVMDVESRFSIKLSSEKLLDPKAKTVKGIVSLIINEINIYEK